MLGAPLDLRVCGPIAQTSRSLCPRSPDSPLHTTAMMRPRLDPGPLDLGKGQPDPSPNILEKWALTGMFRSSPDNNRAHLSTEQNGFLVTGEGDRWGTGGEGTAM